MKVIIAGPRPPKEIRNCARCKNRGWYYDDHGGNIAVERHCDICGGALERWYAANAHFIDEAVAASGFAITKLVCGMAQGFDTLGYRWAVKNNILMAGFAVTKEDWRELGRRAGVLRNMRMGDEAEALIALVADPPTPGTSHMIAYMKGLRKPVYEHPLK